MTRFKSLARLTTNFKVTWMTLSARWPQLIKPTERTCEQQRTRDAVRKTFSGSSCFDRRSATEIGVFAATLFQETIINPIQSRNAHRPALLCTIPHIPGILH